MKPVHWKVCDQFLSLNRFIMEGIEWIFNSQLRNRSTCAIRINSKDRRNRPLHRDYSIYHVEYGHCDRKSRL